MLSVCPETIISLSGYFCKTSATLSSRSSNFGFIMLLFVSNVIFSGATSFISPWPVLSTSTPEPFNLVFNSFSCLSKIFPITAPTAAPPAVPITVPFVSFPITCPNTAPAAAPIPAPTPVLLTFVVPSLAVVQDTTSNIDNINIVNNFFIFIPPNVYYFT